MPNRAGRLAALATERAFRQKTEDLVRQWLSQPDPMKPHLEGTDLAWLRSHTDDRRFGARALLEAVGPYGSIMAAGMPQLRPRAAGVPPVVVPEGPPPSSTVYSRAGGPLIPLLDPQTKSYLEAAMERKLRAGQSVKTSAPSDYSQRSSTDAPTHDTGGE